MVRAFEAAGYPRSWLMTVDLIPADGSSTRAAERWIVPSVSRLLDAAQQHAKDNGCKAPGKVDVVAHSMGSVAARWYVTKLDATRVGNLIGIAPANHGSDAVCELAGEGNRQLCPAFDQNERGTVQSSLNGTNVAPLDETPFGIGTDRPQVQSIAADATRRISYTTFRLAGDEWVQPDTSPVLDGAGGLPLYELGDYGILTTPGNVLWQRSIGHDDFPKDPHLIKIVIASLLRDDVS